MMSELAASGPLEVHAICHLGAVAVLGLAIAADSPALFRIGSAGGLIGAVAFAIFALDVLRRLGGKASQEAPPVRYTAPRPREAPPR